MRTTVAIHPVGSADRDCPEHRERRAAEIEHDVMGVTVGADLGDREVAADRGGDRRLSAVEVHLTDAQPTTAAPGAAAQRNRRIGLRQLRWPAGQRVRHISVAAEVPASSMGNLKKCFCDGRMSRSIAGCCQYHRRAAHCASCHADPVGHGGMQAMQALHLLASTIIVARVMRDGIDRAGFPSQVLQRMQISGSIRCWRRTADSHRFGGFSSGGHGKLRIGFGNCLRPDAPAQVRLKRRTIAGRHF